MILINLNKFDCHKFFPVTAALVWYYAVPFGWCCLGYAEPHVISLEGF